MGHFPIICKSLPVKTVHQVLKTEDALSLTFTGGVTAPTCAIGNPGSLCVTRDITQVNYRERSLGLENGNKNR